MSVLGPNFMLRSMLILSRSCCVDLRAPRCLRAYCTMLNDRLAPILLKKPTAADGRSAISLRAAGSDPPALTPLRKAQSLSGWRSRDRPCEPSQVLSDLLRLPWSSYDGSHLRLRQSKTGRRIVMPAGMPLKVLLGAAERRSPVVLASSYGHGFRASWSRTCARAGHRRPDVS